MLAVLMLGTTAASAQQSDNVFAKAVARAQSRTVKIYGAGIGREPGYATGLLVTDDGRIITALGIYLTGQQIRVVLADGSRHEAKVLRRDPTLQLALLKIDAVTPKYFTLSEKRSARQGDWILAVSNAFKVADGDEPLSVTLGLVSLRTRLAAKRGTRNVAYDGEVLLIDAITSNPGAPGGAVVDADGHLVGMIGKIVDSKETNTRLNYAVPADVLHQFMENRSPKVAKPPPTVAAKGVLGIRLFTLGGRRAPAYIDRILPGSPAAKAGLRSDDLIISLDGRTVRSVEDYNKVVATLKAGKKIGVTIKRKQQVLQISIIPVSEDTKGKADGR